MTQARGRPFQGDLDHLLGGLALLGLRLVLQVRRPCNLSGRRVKLVAA